MVRSSPRTTELVLHHDRALVTQRIEISVGPSKRAQIKLTVPRDVPMNELVILERGELMVAELRGPSDDRSVTQSVPAGEEPSDGEGVEAGDDDDDGDDDESAADGDEPDSRAHERVVPDQRSMTPAELTYAVTAPRPGRFVLAVGYVTGLIRWDASYSMTTTPARDHVVLRGAVAINNRTGMRYPRASVRLVDGELGIRGPAPSRPRADRRPTKPGAAPADHALGMMDLDTGETRVDLRIPAVPRPMRSVLVYDPIGTVLDAPQAVPSSDPALGTGPASPRVTESLEIARGTLRGLPRGRVTLVERGTDGTLGLLGRAVLFEPATRVATVDTIPLGTADKVTGKRERTAITIDEHGHRIVEEFTLTIENARTVAVDVVLREHLYRGLNWTLAFQSADRPSQEGPQQIAMRTRVAPRSSARVLYVVVYTWE
ncbi:MAG: hypothetical protein AB7P03_21055 [Kofleriaceae bacterium]